MGDENMKESKALKALKCVEQRLKMLNKSLFHEEAERYLVHTQEIVEKAIEECEALEAEKPAALEEKRPGHYLQFCGMTMRAFGGRGLPTKFIGKRKTDNGGRIYEIDVCRPSGGSACYAVATENGDEIFSLFVNKGFGIAKYIAVSCLHALIHYRTRTTKRLHESRKRAKAAKRQESAAE